MDLGPILEIRTERKHGIAVRFKGVTAYDYASYTNYHFHGDLAEERAKVWADQHGGTYWKRKDGGHYVKVTRLKASS